MFKTGDTIQRKPEYRNEKYWISFCRDNGVPTDHLFNVISHKPEIDTVRFNSPIKGVSGVYDYKMELANFSLENE